jgi:cytochrome c
MAHYGCTICHDTVESMAGPPWVEVAAKYRGNPNAAAILTRVVRKGVHGSGPWPMPPLPEVTAKDARAIVHYILTIRRPQARPHEPET